jgi:hypothetical protein|tara:strand:- start:1216 stop:1467 length:252 start_codon:yes stop_codon:yes gene_type:complete
LTIGLFGAILSIVKQKEGNMIRIFNSAYGNSEAREIPLSEVNIVTQKINCYTGAPYILFEHKDFPLGALMAQFDGSVWQCDMD